MEINRFCDKKANYDADSVSEFESPDIFPLHRSLPEYDTTPLIEPKEIARKLGVGSIYVKDESRRFGLKAFKALGASYAVYRFLKDEFEKRGETVPDAGEFYGTQGWLATDRYTFCTATDGNHGRGVAWIARKLNQRAIIYMPSDSVRSRVDNIRNEGADVILIDGGYDRAVEQCRKDADQNGWQIISDTSWEGYERIPQWIQAGYITLFREIGEQLGNTRIDIAIIQGGVGALLAAGVWYLKKYSPDIKIISVEPVGVDCLLRSAASDYGQPVEIRENAMTIMAGLNCGTPSKIAWPIIQKGVDFFLAITDNYARDAMREYYHGNPRIISGESGAAGLAALLAMKSDSKLNDTFKRTGINEKSSFLLLNTEGDTDPVNFAEVVRERKR